MIELKCINKRFGKLPVLNNVSVKLQQGECVALIGPNGCGKTTLIKSILGMVVPDAGEIFFDGKSISNDNHYRKDIGYMPQIGRYPENMTIGQVLDMVRGIRNTKEAEDSDLYNLYQIEKMLSKKMRTLSGGTTQKVSATLAFMFNPPVLILDEPTAGLDPLASEILKSKILDLKQKGRLILITSHLLSELENMVSQVVFMQEGNLILHKGVADLKDMTGQETLAKSVVELLKLQR